MSITSALERIERWAQCNDLDFTALLQPGLPRQEAQARTGSLPFGLAEEVYELYGWRNGQKGGAFRLGLLRSPSYPFLPLEEALREYSQFEEKKYEESYLAGDTFCSSGGWLPLLGRERSYLVSAGTKDGTQFSAVAASTHDDPPFYLSSSLSALLEVQADVYEANALRVDAAGNDFFDYALTSTVKRRHFPEEAAEAEDSYRSRCSLPNTRTFGTPSSPTPEEFAQYGLVSRLAQAGSVEAFPAAELFLAWLLGDARQSAQVLQVLACSPHQALAEWPQERSLLVCSLLSSFFL